ASGGIDAVLNSLDIHIARFAANWSNVFIEIANREAKSLELSKAKKKPTVAGIFDPGDPASADLMRRASLNLINNLTNEQRRVIRNALAQGLREGLSTEDLAGVSKITSGFLSSNSVNSISSPMHRGEHETRRCWQAKN